MIQSEIISESSEEEFVESINYFLERLQEHQLIDIKFQILSDEKYVALILYKVEK